MRILGTYRPSLLLALLLLANVMFARWQDALSTPTMDFFIAWSVPRALSIKPIANIYSAEGQLDLAATMEREANAPGISAKQKRATADTLRMGGGKIDAPGSPFLYTVMGLLSSGDYETDQRRFAIVCLASFALSIVVLCQLLQFSWLATILALIVLASSYMPTLSDVMVGNLNQIQLFIITLFIFFLARSLPLLAGVSIGLGMMLKPNLAVIAGSVSSWA
jgi:Glycosyltransferase family 87